MSQVHFGSLSPLNPVGGIQTQAQSNAGDGFNSLFNRLVNTSDLKDSNYEISEKTTFQNENSSEDSSTVKDFFEDELIREDKTLPEEQRVEEGKGNEDISLKEAVLRLTSSEELTPDDMETLVGKIKDLLTSSPELAKKIQDVLESSGLDLSTLSVFSMKEALKELPAMAQEELAALLSTEEMPIPATSVADLLSQALGELYQESKEKNQGTPQDNLPKTNGVSASKESSLDQFLKGSRAWVTELSSKDQKSFDQMLQQEKGGDFSKTSEQKMPETLSTLPGQNVESAPEKSLEILSAQNLLEKSISVKTVSVPGKISGLSTSSSDNSLSLSTMEEGESKSDKMKNIKGTLGQAKSNLSTQIEKSQLMQRLMKQARLHLKDGEGRFQVRLDPPTLGTVKISVENREGVLSALITTENESARQTLQSQLALLKNVLSEQGVHVGHFEVNVDSGGADGSFSGENEDFDNPWKSGREGNLASKKEMNLKTEEEALPLEEGQTLSLKV
jgi:flagellar hook-length control protein FliK